MQSREGVQLHMKSYCGYVKDEALLSSCASGGMAAAIAETVIYRGGVVYGVAYDPDFRGAAYCRVDVKADLQKLRGSKYIKARLGDTYRSVAADLEAGCLVCFFGLPCEVAGLQNMLKARLLTGYTERLITVDLICQGPTSPKVAQQYLDTLEKKYQSKVVDFSVRYKNPDWTPPYLRAVFENGEEYCAEFYATEYGIACSLMSMPGCYTCRFKADGHVSDLTIGDFWGIAPEDEGYHPKGVSVAFVHSSSGEKILQSLPDFALFEADTEKALRGNPRYSTSISKTRQSVRFVEDFERYGLQKACGNAGGVRGKLVKLLPKSWLKWLKRRLRG